MFVLKKNNRAGIFALGVALFAMAASPAAAQDRYSYCKDRAADISGYDGEKPNKHLPGGLLEGAAKGAATGVVGNLIFGGSKKERKKAAKRGAILGGIAGAIKRGVAKDKLKKSARVYRHELDACMNASGSGAN